MCGILGYVGHDKASRLLLDGLRRLEYRGYDSSGIAVFSEGKVQLRRAVGKLSQLEDLLKQNDAEGTVGLGHTRWATHGAPSEANAHPHTGSGEKIIVVHNGIIENYLDLKKKLEGQGYKFRSETDTEVVAHLIESHFEHAKDAPLDALKESFLAAVQASLREIKGTFALGILCSAIPRYIIGARRDCPLIVGLGQKENFLASDTPAILSRTRDVKFLEDGDLAILSDEGVKILDETGRVVDRPTSHIQWDPIQAEKSGFKHFMLKEIHEQPRVVEDTLLGRLDLDQGKIKLDGINITEKEASQISQVRLLACGTSWHAALVGSFWLEKISGIQTIVDIASEFRYRSPQLPKNTLVVAISQSGETADTIAAVRMARKMGAKVLAVANVIGSTLTRDADGSLLTHCGPEIGVASTKAFLGQLVGLYLLALYIGQARGEIKKEALREKTQNLAHLSQWITQTLTCEDQVKKVSRSFHSVQDFLFLGRNLNYPIALEGALKLKEISYIHAEGYPAGEMKHGPIALIDEKMPVLAIATQSPIYEKMLSNILEAKSRGARVIVVANEGDSSAADKAEAVLTVPQVPEELSPMINVIPLQMLAYHIAVLRGCDVDQPRNLAKSVTVE